MLDKFTLFRIQTAETLDVLCQPPAEATYIRDPGPTERMTVGFTNDDRFSDGHLHHNKGSIWVKLVEIRKRHLPPSVVAREVKKRGDTLRLETGHPISRKQQKELTELVTLELLPKAMIVSNSMLVASFGNKLVIGSTSRNDIDLAVKLLRGTEQLDLTWYMSGLQNWLTTRALNDSDWFISKAEGVIEGTNGEKLSVVGYGTDHQEFVNLVGCGWLFSELAMLNVGTEVEVKLNDQGQFKRFKPTATQKGDDYDGSFEADVFLFANDLNAVVADIEKEINDATVQL